MAFFALATGMITGWITGAWGQSELALLQKLWEELRPGDVLLGDRGFCAWGLLAQCQARQIHAVFRVRGSLRTDFRRGKRLGPDERVPDRPGRREPRAVKRRPKPYPRLTCHRHTFREIQHQNRYYKGRPSGSRCGKSSRA